MAGALMLSGVTFTSCDDDNDLNTNQYVGGVSLNVFGPCPVARGGELRFLGSGLKQIQAVLIPGSGEITDIKIDKRKSSNERILDFLNKVKNPYIFKVKGKLVRIRFSDTDKTADDCLTNVLKNLYR